MNLQSGIFSLSVRKHSSELIGTSLVLLALLESLSELFALSFNSSEVLLAVHQLTLNILELFSWNSVSHFESFKFILNFSKSVSALVEFSSVVSGLNAQSFKFFVELFVVSRELIKLIIDVLQIFLTSVQFENLVLQLSNALFEFLVFFFQNNVLVLDGL